MSNSTVKGVLGALALVGVAAVAKKAAKRRNFLREVMADFDIQERTPFAFADKIRELGDDKYEELKDRFKKEFSSNCCSKTVCKSDEN